MKTAGELCDELGAWTAKLDREIVGPVARKLRVWPFVLGCILRDLRARQREAGEMLMLAEYHLGGDATPASVSKALDYIGHAKRAMGSMMIQAPPGARRAPQTRRISA